MINTLMKEGQFAVISMTFQRQLRDNLDNCQGRLLEKLL